MRRKKSIFRSENCAAKRDLTSYRHFYLTYEYIYSIEIECSMIQCVNMLAAKRIHHMGQINHIRMGATPYTGESASNGSERVQR